MARVASKSCETSGPLPAREKVAELPLDERRETVTTGALGGGMEERGEVLAHDLMEHGVLGVARAVGAQRSGGRTGVGRAAHVRRLCTAVFAGGDRDRCSPTAPRLPHGTVIAGARGPRETTSRGSAFP